MITQGKLQNIGSGSIFFFWYDRNIKTIKAKLNKLNLIKVTNVCTSKNTINIVNRWSMKWEKIFADNLNRGWYPMLETS